MTTTMNTGAASLLPCPFCSCSIYDDDIVSHEAKRHTIKCPDCPCRMEYFSSTKTEAIAAWNRRATPQAEAAPIINGHAINDLFLKWSEWTTELGEAISRKNIDGFVSELRAAIAAGGAQEPVAWMYSSTRGVDLGRMRWSDDMKALGPADMVEIPLYAAPLPRAAATVMPDDTSAFKNFHRQLCERFGYVHDEKDWRRDKVSLIEWIAKRLAPAAPSVEQDEPVVMIQGRFVLEADPDFPDLPTHSAWSEIPTKESADRLKAKYGDKIELRELVARAASTSANVAQGAEAFPYQKTFNAIAAATSISGGHVAISVAKFVEAFGAAPPAQTALADDARECLMDVVSHHLDFRTACLEIKMASETTVSDELYWQKQIDVLDRMKGQAERALTAAQSAGGDTK